MNFMKLQKIDFLFTFVIFVTKFFYYNCTYSFKPEITEISLLDDHTINIKWFLNELNKNINLSRYVISYSSNNWISSNEWPAQIKHVNDCDTYGEILSENNIDGFNCFNLCVNKINCKNVFILNSSCVLVGNNKTIINKNINKNNCFKLDVYSNEANIKYLPLNEIYQFKVKVYDETSGDWSLYSKSSPVFDTRIHLVAHVDRINDGILKVKWKSLNNFSYIISTFKISLSINESEFIEIKESNEKISKYNTLIISNDYFKTDMLENFKSTIDINKLNCKNKCKLDSQCTLYIWNEYKKTCLLQMKFETFKIDYLKENDQMKNYVINTANEYDYERDKNLFGQFIFKLEYITIYGNTGVTYASIKIFDDEPKSLIILSFIILHIALLSIVAILLFSCIKRNLKPYTRNEHSYRSMPADIIPIDTPPEYNTVITFQK